MINRERERERERERREEMKRESGWLKERKRVLKQNFNGLCYT